MGFKLNPDAVELFPASGHRRGKRGDWRWTSVSKQQIRHTGGDERCGRRREGLLNPLSGETHKQGMYLDRWTKQKISNRKKRLTRKGRRRARPERRRGALVVLVLALSSYLGCLALLKYLYGCLSCPTYVVWGCPGLFRFCSLVFPLLNPFLEMVSSAGYFHARFLLSAFFSFFPTVFVPDMFWYNFLYL